MGIKRIIFAKSLPKTGFSLTFADPPLKDPSRILNKLHPGQITNKKGNQLLNGFTIKEINNTFHFIRFSPFKNIDNRIGLTLTSVSISNLVDYDRNFLLSLELIHVYNLVEISVSRNLFKKFNENIMLWDLNHLFSQYEIKPDERFVKSSSLLYQHIHSYRNWLYFIQISNNYNKNDWNYLLNEIILISDEDVQEHSIKIDKEYFPNLRKIKYQKEPRVDQFLKKLLIPQTKNNNRHDDQSIFDLIINLLDKNTFSYQNQNDTENHFRTRDNDQHDALKSFVQFSKRIKLHKEVFDEDAINNPFLDFFGRKTYDQQVLLIYTKLIEYSKPIITSLFDQNRKTEKTQKKRNNK